MALYETPNLTGGIDEAIIDIATTVPLFVPMFLMFIFFLVLISGTLKQKRRSGRKDSRSCKKQR